MLVILVLASAASVPTGAGRRLRASARRLAVVLVLSTVVLGAGAWVVSQLVSDRVPAHGVLALGVAPTEIATIALTALAGGEVAVTAALLTSSTVISVLIAGPVLAFEAGGNLNASRVLVDLTLIVALPMLVGLVSRPFVARSKGATAAREPMSMLAVVVLVALVASQVHFTRSYVGVAVALVCFIAVSTASGYAIARLGPADEGTAIMLSTSIRDFATSRSRAELQRVRLVPPPQVHSGSTGSSSSVGGRSSPAGSGTRRGLLPDLPIPW